MRLALAPPAAAALTLALGLGFASSASAHDTLVASNPAAGATLMQAPTTMSLTFSGKVLNVGSSVAVKSPGGTLITRKTTVHGNVVTAPLSAPVNGVYHVTWRATSSDGHPVSGSYDFTMKGQRDLATGANTVGVPASTVTGPSTPTTAEPGDNEPALIFTALGLAIAGTVAAWFFARHRVKGDPQ